MLISGKIIYFVIQSTFIMSNEDYLNDISEIKNLMNKSSRFISLSGISGVLAGLYALIGASITYLLVMNYSGGILYIFHGWVFWTCMFILFMVAFLSVLTGLVFTVKKAKKNNESIWDNSSRRLLINFLIPLIVGGIYCIIILSQGRYGQTGGLMLIFYGLALVSASKYSLGDIKYLGYIEIVLGLIASYYPGYGFWLWVTGFGVMHIVYGTWMHFKFDAK